MKAIVDKRAFIFSTSEDWDCISIKKNVFHIIQNNCSYIAYVHDFDKKEKKIVLSINNQIHTVYLKDRYDELLEKMGMTSISSENANQIVAPMPGLVLDIPVSAGDDIHKGDVLVVLEAMKMENAIKSPGDGTVKNILIQPQDTVEKDQLLIELE